MNSQVPDLATSEASQLFSALKLGAYKAHVIDRIVSSAVGRSPFHHLFIEQIFADELYEGIRRRAFHYKTHAQLQQRLQDSQAFTNNRYSLVGNQDVETRYVREIFEDDDVKAALLEKFYVEADRGLRESLTIHDEFEYVFTAKDRFQNVHVDIPAKFLSLVFYFPAGALSDEDRRANATILYDKNLEPCYKARYCENSVCIFAPHFYTYHGFATTVERAALVMFYVDKTLIERHQKVVRDAKAALRIEAFKDTIQTKLEAFPLLEYGGSRERIAAERLQCLINAPRGRVLRDDSRTEPSKSA